VYELPVQHCAPHRGVAGRRARERASQRGDSCGIHPFHGSDGHLAVRKERDEAQCGLAQARRAGDDCVEHGLNIGRRARDHAQDFARGGLLIERLGDLGMGCREGLVLLLELREQADILDGDDGLVGECLQQGNVLIGERPRLGPVDDDRPQWSTAE
jgi:hypothetical protein